MLRYIRLLLLAIVCLNILSCSNSKDDEPTFSVEEAEYYVKYEADVNTSYFTNSIEYRVFVENGTKTFKSGKTFSETFGPFRKGFHAHISANATNLPIAECSVRIYVSRGSEPFALKANNSGGRSVSTSYTIDY